MAATRVFHTVSFLELPSDFTSGITSGEGAAELKHQQN